MFVLTRHGARAPFYANMDTHDFPYGHQDLTNIGIRQLYSLGANLRKTYIEKRNFNPFYNTTNIRVISTNRSRTVQSALSMLEGLYPFSINLNKYEQKVELKL